jgi:DNA-binding SARP family transcriptional activator
LIDRTIKSAGRAEEEGAVRYRILGPIEVHNDAGSATPTAPKTASVLAILLVHANHLVLTETLMEDIWGEGPPASASTTLQTYIYQIRGALGRLSITTRPGGYCLSVDEDDLDLLAFRSRLHHGRRLLDLGRPDEALDELRLGLSLWRGRPLSNVRCGRVLELDLQHLEEERRRAAELSVEAAFAAGRHREVIADLRLLIANDPYDEWLHARLIEALTLSGRRRDALQAYTELRRMLADHLGLDPMQELQQLERQILGVESTGG